MTLSGPHGPDLSDNNGVIDWTAFARSDASFVVAKASEGTSQHDAWPALRDGAKRAGKRLMAYHFARPDLGLHPQAEADTFLSLVKGTGLTSAWIDWETYPDRDYRTWASPGGWVYLLQLLGLVSSGLYAVRVGPYMNGWFAGLAPPSIASYPLWYADPGVTSAPRAPGPWRSIAMLQYSFSATFPGVGRPCDSSVDLGGVAGPTPPPPVPIPPVGPKPQEEPPVHTVIRSDGAVSVFVLPVGTIKATHYVHGSEINGPSNVPAGFPQQLPGGWAALTEAGYHGTTLFLRGLWNENPAWLFEITSTNNGAGWSQPVRING